jgi:hypothetical protein
VRIEIEYAAALLLQQDGHFANQVADIYALA